MARKTVTKRDGAKAIGYVRVSTMHQVDGGISLEAQRAAIERYCTFKEFDLVEVIEEPGVSGTIGLADRPGGSQLYGKLDQDDAIAHIVALKLDRLFRNVLDCLEVINTWDDEGIALHLVDMGGQALDTSSGNGRFFITVMAALAELESAIASERVAFALARKKERGDDLGGAPYGQRWNTETHAIEPDPDEQEVIELIRGYRKRRMGAQRIANKLNLDQVPARGDRWHNTTVKRIMRREGIR